MPRVAIVSDSTCDLPIDSPYWERIHIIPVHIHFGEETFREGVDIDETEFYARVEREGAIPKTSQPSPGEFAELYRRLRAQYDAIISIHVTAKLSGTYQSAMLAADMVANEIPVHPFDSACGSSGLGFMAVEAVDALDQGRSIEETLARLEQIRARMNIFLSPDNLKFAHLSGRVSALGSTMATLLNIKPIIVLRDGKLLAEVKVRTRKRAMRRMIKMMHARIGDSAARVAVTHAQAPDDAAILAKWAQETFHCREVWLTPLATSIAVHLGPGTVGVVAYALDQDE
ncbi:MAG: DegV family protein [Chloroflexi bacterium]|nr:DegV family protein [Chloroflexota bacterium]